MFDLNTFYKGKDILVLGATGSIGSEVVRQLLKFDVKRVRMFARNETLMFDLGNELNDNRVRELLGDIRDKDRLHLAMKGIDVVINCAALKHVPLCEYNPSEAYKTNVIGVQNVIDVAREAGVDSVMHISTDKAVSPISMMGATKLLGEKIVMDSSFGNFKVKASCIRFGNVANSRGSVIPIFIKQIKKGGPVKLTSADMTRFFMSLSEAVNLILWCTATMDGHEIFILRMKALRILDLAEVLIEEINPKVKVEIIGSRPSEKIYESLMTDEEAKEVEFQENIFVLHPTINVPHFVEKRKVNKVLDRSVYISSEAEMMTKEEIRKMLAKEKII